MEDETRAQFENLNTRFGNVDKQFENLNALIDNVLQSLKRGIERVDTKLDTIQSTLDRQGDILNPGSSWVARMVEWTERADPQHANLLRRVERLEARLDRLEAA